MIEKKAEIQRAIHTIMNDVVEKCFHQMMVKPEQGPELNLIIDEASQEISLLSTEIKSAQPTATKLQSEDYFNSVSKKLNKRSLTLLSRLQKLQRGEIANR